MNSRLAHQISPRRTQPISSRLSRRVRQTVLEPSQTRLNPIPAKQPSRLFSTRPATHPGSHMANKPNERNRPTPTQNNNTTPPAPTPTTRSTASTPPKPRAGGCPPARRRVAPSGTRGASTNYDQKPRPRGPSRAIACNPARCINQLRPKATRAFTSPSARKALRCTNHRRPEVARWFCCCCHFGNRSAAHIQGQLRHRCSNPSTECPHQFWRKPPVHTTMPTTHAGIPSPSANAKSRYPDGCNC